MPGRRLLYVHNTVPYFLAHRLAMARAARAAGWTVHLAAPEPEAAGRALLADEEIIFHPLPLTRRGMAPWRELQSPLALGRLYRQVQPDLVHLYTIKPALYGGLMARLLGTAPYVATIPGRGWVFTTAPGLTGRVLRRGVGMAYRLALGGARCRAIFENPDDRNFFVDQAFVAADQAQVILGCGVDPARYRPLPRPSGGCARVVFASRMLRDKGVAEFVAAARRLRAGGVAAEFVLLGLPDPGNPDSLTEQELAAWNAAGAVQWWGYRQDMPEILAATDIVCLPTAYGEGVPRILIEAAACGCALIAADRPGCREIVRDGVNGLLVPPRDADALAQALETLLANPERCQRMGQAGRTRVIEQFTEAHVVAQTLAVYEELTG
ncbi:MAG TPA: glycosyltransferase family 4 protein [Candidatus Macondimonas sp.]|nr:glycosyltransferase family 4 protein [Candidatus Macondimonas sp.]